MRFRSGTSARVLELILTAVLAAAGSLPAWAVEVHHFDIPEEAASAAIHDFGEQAHVQIMVAGDAVRGKKLRAVAGDLSTEDALNKLLSGSGLTHKYVGDTAIALMPMSQETQGGATGSAQPDANGRGGRAPAGSFFLAQADQGQAQVDQGAVGSQVPSSDEQSSEKKKKNKDEGLSEIVVTGTYLHNVEPLSPLTTITHDDIINQGYTRLDQVFSQLPENSMAGASAESNPTNGLGEGASQNYSRGSGVNLFGLGANATLVLLNGERMAMSNFGQSVDISLIPVSIIDRVEILSDGASATYGADAVGGVVNIITRNDYSGTEVGGRTASISAGKAPNFGGDILHGFNWSGGNLVVDVDYEKDQPLYTDARSFTSTNGNPTNILPAQDTASYFGALRQEIAEGLSVSADALYAKRNYSVQSTTAPVYVPTYDLSTSGDSEQFNSRIQVNYGFADWHVLLGGHYSREQGITDFAGAYVGSPASQSSQSLVNTDSGADARLDGSLFEVPGGPARLAIGGSFRSERIDTNDLTLTPPPPSGMVLDGSRSSASAFGELLIPLLGEKNAIPLVEKVTLDIAGRYDHYSDFASSFDPKYALKWQIPGGLNVHGSYGRSYRVPTLYENIPQVFGAYVDDVPDPQSATGTSRILAYGSYDPHLQPERSRSVNAGLTFAPVWQPELKVDVSYFDIYFRNKIEQLAGLGFFTNVLTEQSELGSLVTRNPSLAQVNAILDEPGQQVFSEVGPFTPSQIVALANLGYVNAASVHPKGLSADARYGWDTAIGHLSIDLAALDYVSYQDQLAPGAVSFQALNMPYLPLKFRTKFTVAWKRNGWASYARVSFANSYHNPGSGDPVCPDDCPVASWTTVDAGVAYSTQSGESSGRWSGLRFGLDVLNVFDRPPPFVYYGSGFNYDSANATALQRALSASITKSF